MAVHQLCVCMLLFWLVLVSADPKKLADSNACYERLGNCDTTDDPLDDDDFPVISDDLLKRATKLQGFKKDKEYFQFKVIGLGEDEAYNYRIYRCGCNPDPNDAFTILFTHSNALYVDEHPIIAGIYEIDRGYIAEDIFVRYYPSISNVYEKEIRELMNAKTIKAVPIDPDTDERDLSVINAEAKTSIIGAFSTQSYLNFDDELPPFLLISEVLEEDPVGRAVWLYIIGIIMGKARQAKELLENVEKRYSEIEKAIRNDEKFVYSVFYNAPFTSSGKTTWFQPSANQYVTEIGNDALTAYRYSSDQTSGTIEKNVTDIVDDFRFARILHRASVYGLREIIGGDNVPTIDQFVNFSTVASERAKVRSLRAVLCGNVWYSKRVRSDGADDLFGSAIFKPDVVLEDTRRIVHSADGEDIENLIYFQKYKGTGGNCTYPKIGKKGDNETLREVDMSPLNITWFDLEAILPNLTMAMKDEGYPNFDMRWKKENYDKEKDDNKVTATIVAYTTSEDEDKFKEDAKRIFREVSEAGEIPKAGGGIGAGGIIGIIIAVIIVLGLVVFLCARFRKPKTPIGMGGEWQDAPQSGTPAQGDGGMGGDPFDTI